MNPRTGVGQGAWVENGFFGVGFTIALCGSIIALTGQMSVSGFVILVPKPRLVGCKH